MRTETRNGKRIYDIRTFGPDGNKVRERRNLPDSIQSATSIKRWTEARQAHLTLKGAEPIRPPKSLTLNEFGPRWIKEYAVAEGLKASTVDTYKRHLRLHIYPVLGSRRLDEIQEPQIQKLKLALASMGAKSRSCVLSTLANLLNTAEDWKEIDRAPKIQLPRFENPPMAFYDVAEWEQLVEGASKAGPHVLAMILLGGEAGVRRGELLVLNQADAAAGRLTVARNEWQGKIGLPKGGKIRRVPLTTRLSAALAAIKHLRGPRMFYKSNGRPVRIATLQSWLEAACRRAGLPASRNLHKLRHTFCSHLAMEGVPVMTVKELAGHADLKTTMRYMHLAKGSLEAGIAALERGAGGEQPGAEATI